MIAYGTLAATYRWFVLAAIVVAIVCFTNENSIVVVGWLAAAGLLLWVMRGLLRSKQRSRRQLPSDSTGGLPNLFSKAVMTAVVAGLVWFVCCVPLPRWVYVDVQVQPTKTQTLFATSNGFVDMAKLSSGDVKTDQVILDLQDPEL